MGLHEACTRSGSRTGHFLGGTAAGKLFKGVGSSLHVGKLNRTLLIKVIIPTNNADLGLARLDGINTNLYRLDSSSTSTNRSLDGTRRG
ncbi:hypothetical protein DSO57_1020219 [Entomophthora muscae]|uniref:Uncharacterized protein n=1 Tax=Entomophthora muscae TaxID=34485 RepID=A0ACC2U2A5_9FUNG|nr:hypothetical protein DSO57_1020219 [Entomophthora muscae]